MRVLQGILLSLFFHFLLAFAVKEIPLLPGHHESVTVEIIDSKTLAKMFDKQIVRDHLVPEKLKVQSSDDPLSFFSAQTQRVQKQTRAQQVGMTKNRSQESSSEKPEKQQEKQVADDARREKELDPFGVGYKTLPSMTQDMGEMGSSTIGEALPKEVEVGSFTALNTDRYLYYSFYARIEELIRYRWESAVSRTIDSTPISQFGAHDTWVTNLEIWLKPTGEYHSAHLMKESGIHGFDQAAIQAFIQARLFPNPPKEMVQEDGMIKLKYAFRVYHRPNLLGRGQSSNN